MKHPFDEFVDRLSANMDSNIQDYKVFIEFQKECIELLEHFNSGSNNRYEARRRLGTLRLKIRSLYDLHLSKKKVITSTKLCIV